MQKIWEEGAVEEGENRDDDESSESDEHSDESRNANVADDGSVVSDRLACIKVILSSISNFW